MPYLNLTRGEPWAETWAVMHFPDDAAKREVFIAKTLVRVYPDLREDGGGKADATIGSSVGYGNCSSHPHGTR
jgi:hypothetical protein